MKKKIILFSFMFTIGLVACQGNTGDANASVAITASPAVNQRIIVTTDIGGTDPDDEESMVHLLLVSNDVDIEGIICAQAFVKMTPGVSTVNNIINAYSKALPNLKVHSDKYPSAEYLSSIVSTGQTEVGMAGVGEGKDSKGSELIIKAVDKDDSRPVWLASWCGMNTIAQALWKVKSTRTATELDRFISKIRVFDVLGQDDAGAWITKNFPQLFYIRCVDVYGWGPSDEWTRNNIQAYPPMGCVYPTRKWATEGDSPSFFYLVNNGLNAPEHIDYGSWGGRFDLEKKAGVRGMDWVVKNGMDESQYDPYYMYSNSAEGGQAISRWKDAIANDFAARIQWSVTSDYKKANHHPLVVLDNEKTASKAIIEKTADASSDLHLDASGSADPDGDKLQYNWYIYQEASTYSGKVAISGNQSTMATVHIPSDASGKTIQVILEVSDSGRPTLISYRRIVVHVK